MLAVMKEQKLAFKSVAVRYEIYKSGRQNRSIKIATGKE